MIKSFYSLIEYSFRLVSQNNSSNKTEAHFSPETYGGWNCIWTNNRCIYDSSNYIPRERNKLAIKAANLAKP